MIDKITVAAANFTAVLGDAESASGVPHLRLQLSPVLQRAGRPQVPKARWGC